MAEKLDDNEIVTFDEPVIDNTIEVDPLTVAVEYRNILTRNSKP